MKNFSKYIIIVIMLLNAAHNVKSQPVWNYQNSGTSNNLNKIIIQYSASGIVLFVVGDNGTILRSSNRGLIWESVSSNTNADLFSVDITDIDTGYAAGSDGTILRTIDGGNSLSVMTSNTSNTIKSIKKTAGNVKAVAVGENGTFLKLENDVWSVSQIDTADLNSVYIQNSTTLTAVGNSGLILRSTNSGLNWTRINSNTASNLNDITFNNQVIGDNGTAFRINGTNIVVINSGTTNNLYGQDNSSSPVMACGANGTVLKNWQQLNTYTNHKFNSVIQIYSDYCLITGDNGIILFTNSLNQTPNSKLLDVNNISTWFGNNGSFNRHPTTGNSGFEWPKGSTKFARYASGLWIGAKVGNDTLVAVAEYSYEYLPGYIDNSGIPQGSNDSLYHVYSIYRDDSTSADYLNWPVNQGAYLNSQGKPFSLGTQTMFYSYTDGYASAHGNVAGSTAPMKAVILQTNWSYINVNMQDVAFTEYRIINRNNLPWNNAYFAIWTDDDLGQATDDAVACDTNLSLGFTYNYDDYDGQYGVAPPAVGFLVLRSPVVYSIGDTAKYFNPPGSNNLVVKPNYKQSGLTSFYSITGGLAGGGDPSNFHETYNVLQGKKTNGTAWINPVTNQPTLFTNSGDPVSGTGWIMNSGDERRFIMSMGPLNINPGDTQSVIVAQIIARGSSNLNSITKLRELSGYIREVYNNNFQGILGVENYSVEIPDQYNLSQNFPNPFNPVTKINYELRVANFVSIIVYDILGKKVGSFVNQNLNARSYELEFDGSNFASGIYFYSLYINGNPVDTKRMMLLK